MSIELRVDRFSARYLLADHQRDQQARLDRVLEGMVHGRLDPALQRCELPHEELVCIDTLHVPVELDLHHGSADLERVWADALAAAIRDRSHHLDAGLVVYPSLAAARADALARSLRYDLERVWAWRQLGIIAPTGTIDAHGVIAAVLAVEPQAIAAVLGAAARRHQLWTAVRRIGPDTVLAAVTTLASRLSPPVELSRLIAEVRADRPTDGSTATTPPVIEAAVIERLRRGPLAGQPAAPPAAESDQPLVVAAALAMLLDHDPAVVFDASIGRRGSLAGLLSAVLATPSGSVGIGHVDRADPEVEIEDRPRARREARGPVGDEPTSAAMADQDVTDGPAGSGEPSDDAAEIIPETGDGHDRRPISDVAGLVFLLNLLDALGGPTILTSRPVLAGRTSRWLLHRLAIALSGAGPADPAVLAFAGRSPDHFQDLEEPDPPSPAELDAIHDTAGLVAAELVQRLGRHHEPSSFVVADVIARRGHFGFFPGWVEVELDLDDVQVDVRRAGLDLDPGFVPWLGIAVRIRYV